MRTPCDRAVPYTAELDCKEHAAMHPARKIFLGKVSQERGDCPRLFQEERTGAPNRYQAPGAEPGRMLAYRQPKWCQAPGAEPGPR